MFKHKEYLFQDAHFQKHLETSAPVQVYLDETHLVSGVIAYFNANFIKVDGTYYNRLMHTFVASTGA